MIKLEDNKVKSLCCDEWHDVTDNTKEYTCVKCGAVVARIGVLYSFDPSPRKKLQG